MPPLETVPNLASDHNEPAPGGDGLSFRVRRVPGAPVIAARLWLRGGSRLEDIPGQALVTGRLLAEGTRRRDYQGIARDAEDRGILLQSFGTYESLGVAIDCLAEDGSLALGWLAELLFEPTFAEDRLSWIRRQAAAELDSMLDAPEARAAQAFQDQLYYPHAYGRPVQGSRLDLERLTSADCRRFHQRSMTWGGCLVITGDLDEEGVHGELDELFGGRLGGHVAPPQAPAPTGREGRRQEIPLPSGEQAHLYAGHLTVARNHVDLPALEVASVVLGAGSGLVGRLPERIRERQGLAYQVDVRLGAGAGLDAGRMVVYVGTSPQTLGDAESAIYQELERFLDGGIRDDEFEAARSYLLGRDPFRRQTARQWADLLTEAEFYGLPTHRPEWVSEVLTDLTRCQVEEAVRRHIRPAELRWTVGLPTS